jgi:FkbM family methyltransferase
VVEVGVGPIETSVVAPWIEQGIRAALVEPDPDYAEQARRRLGARPNLEIHQVAVGAASGRVAMYRRGPSTFLASLNATPAVVNDRYVPRAADRMEVLAVTFDQLDDGSIDLLAVDVEGAEWLVIRALRSRPAVIALETHGAAYRNPSLDDLHEWMRREGYAPWFMTWSDTVFVHPSRLRPGWLDRVALAAMRGRVALRIFRKRLFRAIRRRLGEASDGGPALS